MSEIEYEICVNLKRYYEIHGFYPSITEVSEMIHRTYSCARYHVMKLKKIGIVDVPKSKRVKLIVNME